MCLWMFEQLGRVISHRGATGGPAGHIVELCPQTNLMVGVYLAAALFSTTIRLFFKQTVLAIQYTDTFTR